MVLKQSLNTQNQSFINQLKWHACKNHSHWNAKLLFLYIIIIIIIINWITKWPHNESTSKLLVITFGLL